MKRKLISIALVTALVMVSFVGASLAYFQDQETVTNTFTMGDVDIAIVEMDGTTDKGSDLGTGEGMSFDRVLPGEVKDKAPFIKVKDTSVDSYIAAKVTVNNATNFIARTGSAWNLFSAMFNGGLSEGAVAAANAKELQFNGQNAVGYEVSSAVGTDNKVFLMVNVDDTLDVIEYYFVYEKAQTVGELDELFEKVVIPTTLKQSDVPADKKITVKIDAYAIQKSGYTAPATGFGIDALAGLAEVSGVVAPVSNNVEATNVASAADFTAAIANGGIITLTQNVVLENPVTLNKETVIVGDGNTIISEKPMTAKANLTLKDIVYQNPDNAANNASMVYAAAGAKEIVFDNCTFSNPQWEVVQITSNDFEKLTITNCVFTADEVDGANAAQYGNDADQCIRYIHVQPSANTNSVEIVITNNTFKNIDKVADSVAGIYYVNGTITIGENTFAGWADGDVDANGKAAKLSVSWPENDALKEVAKWTGAIQTYNIAP